MAENEMRVSDAEREAAASELREHFATGRLSAGEFDQRLSAVFAARTRGDLDALFADLPLSEQSGPAGGGPQAGPGGRDARDGQAGRDGGAGRRGFAGAGHIAAQVMLTTVAFWVLLALGILGVFGIGAGRPLGIVLLVAALGLLKRLFSVIAGRRRGPRGRGRGRRC